MSSAQNVKLLSEEQVLAQVRRIISGLNRIRRNDALKIGLSERFGKLVHPIFSDIVRDIDILVYHSSKTKSEIVCATCGLLNSSFQSNSELFIRFDVSLLGVACEESLELEILGIELLSTTIEILASTTLSVNTFDVIDLFEIDAESEIAGNAIRKVLLIPYLNTEQKSTCNIVSGSGNKIASLLQLYSLSEAESLLVDEIGVKNFFDFLINQSRKYYFNGFQQRDLL
jgi:hypothetical protein